MPDQDEKPQEQAELTVKDLSGFEEGTVLEDGETVVGSYDDDGKLVGWHKQPATEEDKK